MPRLRNAAACQKAVDTAMAWLEPHFDTGEEWSARPLPLLTYHKLPYLMSVRGHLEECRRALSWIKANLMTADGDLRAAPADGKATVAQIREKSWVALSAQVSARYDISFAVARFLAHHQGGSTGAVYDVDADGQRETTADVRTTASAGLVFLATGRRREARAAGRFLAGAIQSQTDHDRFYVRVDSLGRAVSRLPREQTGVVKSTRRGPELSYLAVPIVFLTRLYLATDEAEWRDTAMDYFVFTEQFLKESPDCPDSASMAWAAAALYSVTRRRVYYDSAERLVQTWIDKQRSDGSWRVSRDEAENIALTTQTALCLLESLREAQ